MRRASPFSTYNRHIAFKDLRLKLLSEMESRSTAHLPIQPLQNTLLGICAAGESKLLVQIAVWAGCTS